MLHKEKPRRQVPVTTMCPSEMVSFWTKRTLPTALIDVPNKKKVVIPNLLFDLI